MEALSKKGFTVTGEIREYKESDIPHMVDIWNQVVEEAVAFPQEEFLDELTGKEFFSSQTYCGVAAIYDTIIGLYILHPNNIGRCGHIANASYAVENRYRGLHIGEKLVIDSLLQGKRLGFEIMQFNAVVENNTHARNLYKRLGFSELGMIPDGFRFKDNSFGNIYIYYHKL